MKKQYLFTVTILIAINTLAQQQPLPYNKQHLDSLFGQAQKFNLPLLVPVPKNTDNFNDLYLTPLGGVNVEELYRGATIINKTGLGTIYSMPPDNMAVMAPDMKQLEKMPGSSLRFRVSPQGNMPNPLYPKVYTKRKK